MDKKILDLLTEQLTAKEVGIVKETFERKEQLETEVFSLKTTVEYLSKDLSACKKENEEVMDRITKAIEAEDRVKAQSILVEAHEKAILEKEYKLDVAAAQKEAGVWKEAMTMMLRPASTRRLYQEKITNISGNGAYSNDTLQPAIEEVIEE